MKTLVTGGTGFIGTELVRHMAQTDHELTCLVRTTSDVSTLRALNIPTVVGDVTDRESLRRAIPGHDAVIHLANVYDFWIPDKRLYYDVNVEGTRNVMEVALAANVAKVVHVSTSLIYGHPVECPFTEECEPGPKRFSAYAQSKYEGTQIAWDLYRERGLPLVGIYPAGVLGPGDPKSTGRYVLNLINRSLLATVFNSSVLTLVHVGDVVDAIIGALEKDGNIGEKYLIGGHTLSFDEINAIVSEISGVPLPKTQLPRAVVMVTARFLTAIANITKRPPLWDMSVDQMRTMKEGFQFNGSKAARELGFTYTPLRTALEEEITAYRAAA